MPDIKQAYNTAFNMNRSPAGLICVYDKTIQRGYKSFVGTIEGSSDTYTSTIILRNKGEDQWHCSCQDFRFTFHPHIDDNGFALYPFPEYIPNGRGQPRAIHDFGMCKHLMHLLDVLRSDGHAKGR